MSQTHTFINAVDTTVHTSTAVEETGQNSRNHDMCTHISETVCETIVYFVNPLSVNTLFSHNSI